MYKKLFFINLFLIILILPTQAQEKITQLKLSAEHLKLRPFESTILQLQVYGEITKDKQTNIGRLRRNGAEFYIVEQNGGCISKPFHSKNENNQSFIKERNIFWDTLSDIFLQDSILYTAPEHEGKYTVEVSLNGKKTKFIAEVSQEAPRTKSMEKTSFPKKEISDDPYLEIVQNYAPYIAQETWFEPKADYITRFDYDGDWKGNNNWDNLNNGTSQAYVYYTTMETSSHWFIIYNFFHPRDYSDKCIAGTCHENDNEGLILTIVKDGSKFGRLQTMETLAHNNIYSFSADNRIQNGVHDIDGKIEFFSKSHPIVFIESGGHGVFGSQAQQSRYNFSEDKFLTGTGVTYFYKGNAQRPKSPNDRQAGYELLPIYSQLWTKIAIDSTLSEKTFDKYFHYHPLGRRPEVPFDLIPETFYGMKEAEDKAKPFWSWEDKKTSKEKLLAVGQWALDPAYAVSIDLTFPEDEPFSLDYIFNPYLGINNRIKS